MRFLRFREAGRLGLAVSTDGEHFTGLREGDADYPGDLGPHLLEVMSLGQLANVLLLGHPVEPDSVECLEPLSLSGKVLCIGLNYRGHAAETGQDIPDYPTVFARFSTSLVGGGNDLVCPAVSSLFDYEGELAIVIGKRGRRIAREDALQYVAGYCACNDGSIRDYQLLSTHWTMGKNFDRSGSIGPHLVCASALPAGASGLRLRTRLNGVTVQDSNTDDLIFDVVTLVSLLSEVMTLEPGDLIITGTPAGVAMASDPPVWMKAGDICEVEIEGIGVLRNGVVDEMVAS